MNETPAQKPAHRRPRNRDFVDVPASVAPGLANCRPQPLSIDAPPLLRHDGRRPVAIQGGRVGSGVQRRARVVLDAEIVGEASETLAAFAHELTTPLNNIHMQVQLLQRSLDKTELAEGLAPRVAGIAAEVARLTEMLEKLRRLAPESAVAG